LIRWSLQKVCHVICRLSWGIWRKAG
jgi:hypothetical protein